MFRLPQYHHSHACKGSKRIKNLLRPRVWLYEQKSFHHTDIKALSRCHKLDACTFWCSDPHFYLGLMRKPQPQNTLLPMPSYIQTGVQWISQPVNKTPKISQTDFYRSAVLRLLLIQPLPQPNLFSRHWSEALATCTAAPGIAGTVKPLKHNKSAKK